MANEEVSLCLAINALWQAQKHAMAFDDEIAARIGEVRDQCYREFDRRFNNAASPPGDQGGELSKEPVP